jgi:hypothetical protein
MEHNTSQDDGTFCMQFSDVIDQFNNMYICRNFDAESGYLEQTLHGEWAGDTAGGCSNNQETYHKNPQFLLKVEQPTQVFLELSQEDARGLGSDTEKCIGMTLMDLSPCNKGGALGWRYLGSVPLRFDLPSRWLSATAC